MLQSPAVLVVMATDFCCGWGNACIISMTPTFMKVDTFAGRHQSCLQEVLGFDIANNGLTSMLPHLARTIVGNVRPFKIASINASDQFAGFLSDLLLRTGMKPLTAQVSFFLDIIIFIVIIVIVIVTVTIHQKIFQAMSFLLPAAGMFAISQLSSYQLRWSAECSSAFISTAIVS